MGYTVNRETSCGIPATYARFFGIHGGNMDMRTLYVETQWYVDYNARVGMKAPLETRQVAIELTEEEREAICKVIYGILGKREEFKGAVVKAPD